MTRATQPSALGRVVIAGTVFVGLAGCTIFQESCHEPQEYQTAQSVPPLKVPEGLDAPQTRGALKIPDVGATARDRRRGDPCLDEPPSFYPGRPKPGQARAEGGAPASPAETAKPAEGEAPKPPPPLTNNDDPPKG